MKTAYIYKITNLITNKSYIGFTTNYKYRFWHHKSRMAKNNSYLSNAIQKYGKDNFTFEVIYCSKDIDHTLNTMENYFIIVYDTKETGYNLTLGGQGGIGKVIPESAKLAISKTWLIKMPQNELIKIRNLSRYCKVNNLSYSCMLKIARKYENRTQHKGYRILAYG